MKGATPFDKACHRIYAESGNGLNYLSRNVGVRCIHCGNELETYYCEERLYLVECCHCKMKILVMADNRRDAAYRSIGQVTE